jgi:hypothetical protein
MALAIGLIACNHTEKSADAPTGAPLYINTAVRPFSDAKLADTLTVSINGESILTGEVFLRIRNHTGKDIYTATFPASDLVTHEGAIEPTQDEEIVTKSMNTFFRGEHFSPAAAVSPELPATPDSLKTAWKTIQADSSVVSFAYPAGGTLENRIAYSKSLRKVIRVETKAVK